jgi:hypothetical protein
MPSIKTIHLNINHSNEIFGCKEPISSRALEMIGFDVFVPTDMDRILDMILIVLSIPRTEKIGSSAFCASCLVFAILLVVCRNPLMVSSNEMNKCAWNPDC